MRPIPHSPESEGDDGSDTVSLTDRSDETDTVGLRERDDDETWLTVQEF